MAIDGTSTVTHHDDSAKKKKDKQKSKRKHKDEDGINGAKKSRKGKKRKRDKEQSSVHDGDYEVSGKQSKKKSKRKASTEQENSSNHFPFEYQHILAPMVGASELAFRLLCRKYGATLSYTPMMSSSQFVQEAASMKNTVADSNLCEFQTIPQDRPLVCHFSANQPQDFAKAAKLVEKYCDAIDLNLGCPQRTAFIGHFGSYLLGQKDR